VSAVVVDSSAIRVADADRERVAEDLREHMMAGRLTAEEFEERIARAYKAVTRAELDELTADLPLGLVRMQRELTRRKAKLRRRLFEESGGAIGVSLLCVAIWLASGAHGGFWPGWVMLVALLPIVRGAWRLLGPDPDLDAVEAQLARRQRRLARKREGGGGQHRGLPR
jgi:Domain of unknown function (DUF1707)